MKALKVLWSIQIVFIVALQFRLWGGEGSFVQTIQLQSEIDLQLAENAHLAARNERLMAQVQNLQSGVEAMEAAARYQQGMIKQNETFFLVVDR